MDVEKLLEHPGLTGPGLPDGSLRCMEQDVQPAQEKQNWGGGGKRNIGKEDFPPLFRSPNALPEVRTSSGGLNPPELPPANV